MVTTIRNGAKCCNPKAHSVPAKAPYYFLLSGREEDNGLRRSVYEFSKPQPPANYPVRIAPQLVGMGLSEAIPEEQILVRADPEDSDGDGIFGRVGVVSDLVTGDPRLGRFGWKAEQPGVKLQVAAALRTDMGVLNEVYSTPDCGSAQADCGPSGAELDEQSLDNVARYIALLGVANQNKYYGAQILAGEIVFEQIGCESCHTATFTISQYSPLAELRSQNIRPYTDLLLHDMGVEQADILPEGNASVAEWRTAPLWGIGHGAQVSGGEGYLHDGRARTLSEAIRWHGGEAKASKLAFEALSDADRATLLEFLASL